MYWLLQWFNCYYVQKLKWFVNCQCATSWGLYIICFHVYKLAKDIWSLHWALCGTFRRILSQSKTFASFFSAYIDINDVACLTTRVVLCYPNMVVVWWRFNHHSKKAFWYVWCLLFWFISTLFSRLTNQLICINKLVQKLTVSL